MRSIAQRAANSPEVMAARMSLNQHRHASQSLKASHLVYRPRLDEDHVLELGNVFAGRFRLRLLR